MSEPAARASLRECIAANPGVHFNELVRRLDQAPGQVQYHARRLRDAGQVVDETLYGRTHFFPPTFDDWERRAVALLRRETARDVVLVILDDGPTSPNAVADAVGVARSTLEWHLDRLVAQDLVRKNRTDDGRRVVLTAARPEATARLLDTVSPTIPERMIDRFDRLLDALLSGD